MLSSPQSWMSRLRHAVAAPGNLIAGASAVMLSATVWNPLPLVLYALGEPIWLYRATSSDRGRHRSLEDRCSLELLQRQLRILIVHTPCGRWIRERRLPDYPGTYGRLVDTRDHTARIVGARDDAATTLEEDIVSRMDDMLCAYLMMAKERLLLHCMLARIYPELPGPEVERSLLERVARALVAPRVPPALPPWQEDTRFVSLDDASREVQTKATGFLAELARQPEHGDVFRPILEMLEKRHEELAKRGRNDRQMAAQLDVFPDQFELILSKLATSQADVGEVIDDMRLLLEQTEDTVSFAEGMRSLEH